MRYRVVKESRKSLRLFVEEEVIIKAPYGVSKTFIDSFVQKHREWIQKQLAKAKEQERYYYLFGKRYEKKEDVTSFLYEEAKRYLVPRGWELARDFVKRPTAIKVSRAKKRWGSCSNRGTINLSYRCIMLPKECIDYVIIHELCHLLYPNHSRAFWELLQEYMPNFHEMEMKIRDF